jgi:galactokinase
MSSSPDERDHARARARAWPGEPEHSPEHGPKDGAPHVRAFAPGRVCLIGEHTDYNDGLALAFAIAEGVTVDARRIEPEESGREDDSKRVQAHALDFGERDEFALSDPQPAPGWRAFVRGTVAELRHAGLRPVGASLEIEGSIPRGAGLSSSAALEVALSLALLALAGTTDEIDRTKLAKLCARVENEWAGAQTGLLDQLSSLHGEQDMALRIDFQTLRIDPAPLHLDGWRLVTLDSGEQRENASSGYNQRRAECARACELLGIGSLREASWEAVERLPSPLRERARHVLSDNERVQDAVAALRAGDLPGLAALLNVAHASLRDDLDVSTPKVEATVRRMLDAGAAGARLLGGGFGGSVLGLLPPGVPVPAGGLEVRPCAGARVLEAEARRVGSGPS